MTVQETSTEIHPVYEPMSFSRTEVHRGFSNGHAASSATKELDDLMASLSEFKVRRLDEVT